MKSTWHQRVREAIRSPQLESHPGQSAIVCLGGKSYKPPWASTSSCVGSRWSILPSTPHNTVWELNNITDDGSLPLVWDTRLPTHNSKTPKKKKKTSLLCRSIHRTLEAIISHAALSHHVDPGYLGQVSCGFWEASFPRGGPHLDS